MNMSNFEIIMTLVASGLILSLGALLSGFIVFRISKSNVLGTLTMIPFFMLQFEPMVVNSYYQYELLYLIIIATVINILLVILVGNCIFYAYEKCNNKIAPSTMKSEKKCSKDNYPKVTTKNRFNKRSLYRLSK